MENIIQFHYTETIHAVMEGGREGGRRKEDGGTKEGESEEVKRRVKDLYLYITHSLSHALTHHACKAHIGSTSVTNTTAPSPFREEQHPLPT